MIRFLAIVPALFRDQANRDASMWDTDTTEHWFVPLNADGLSTTLPSHYWGSRTLSESNYAILRTLAATYIGSYVVRWDIDTDPTLPDRVLAQMGLKRISAA